MIYFYIYIAIAIIFGIINTKVYLKNAKQLDKRIEYVGKTTIRNLYILTFIISTLFMPIILGENLYRKLKGVKQNG